MIVSKYYLLIHHEGQIPIHYIYEKGELPLGLHLLSTDANYKKHMDFITFEKLGKDIIRQFKSQQLSHLVFVVADPKQSGIVKFIITIRAKFHIKQPIQK
jgi:hypothetical protein